MFSELLPEDKRRLHELELQLVELERGSPYIQASDINLGLNEMSGRLDELERLASRESKSHRDDCKRRVQHLRTSHNHIKGSLESYMRRKGLQTFDAKKQELFWKADLEGGEGNLDHSAAENSSLSQSERMVREYIAIGQTTLSELTSQRDRLKVVQKKALDMMNYLGLSNSIMRFVEKRDVTDRNIVFVGMAVISLLLFAVWYFVKR